ncbi:hypothetical protein GCM10022254_33510 [Actinomadura meridiana]|uniref:Uncharacterized protein n=1 Tax=Actinomadura meridiana TaxID=559626 RepID=A0ABP8C2Y9_9ACTN
MVGVDHTSGTDTKVETDKPQPPDDTYQPPPDRPGSPGQPSRLESKAAAQAPTETSDDDPPAEESGPTTELQAKDLPDEPEPPATTEPPTRDRYLDPNDDPNRVGTPRADSWARAAERNEETTDQRAPEPTDQASPGPEQPAEWPDVPLGPRAESRARAREAQQAALTADTDQPDAPDAHAEAQPGANTDQPTAPDTTEATTDRPDPEDEQPNDRDVPPQDQSAEAEPPTDDYDLQSLDDAETEPDPVEPEPEKPDTDRPDDRTHDASADDGERLPTDRDDPRPLPDGTERNEEMPDGTGDGNDTRGSNSEDQSESPAPEENETDQFAGLPTRADLDPASAGEITAERGEPLQPINETQDLREPDPERDSDWRKLLRNVGNDADDALSTSDGMSSTTLKLTNHRPPTDLRTGTRENTPEVGNTDHSANYPSAAVGALAAVMVMYSFVRGLRATGRKIMRRNNDSSD